MPNIKEFDAGQLGLQPSEIGVEATAAAARRGGAFFNQAAQDVQTLGERYGSSIRDAGNAAVKFAEHQEIANGAAHFSALQLAKDQEWQQTAKNADPGDPSVAAKFREESLNPSLDDFRQSFMTEGGQQWAEHHVDQYRQHMFMKTSADMSELAADNIHVKSQAALNAQINRVYGDPTAINDAMGMWAGTVHGLADSSPNLTAVQNAKVKNDLGFKGTAQLVDAAIKGSIDKGGDWRRIADDPKYQQYVNKNEAASYERRDRSLRHAEEADARTAERYQKMMDQSDAMDRANDYSTKYMDPKDGRQKFPENFRYQVMTDPVLAKYPTARKQVLAEYDRFLAGKDDEKLKVTSQQTVRELLSDMRSGTMHGNGAVYDALDQGRITIPDFNFVMKQFEDNRTPQGQARTAEKNDFWKRWGSTIDPNMVGNTPSTPVHGQKFYQAEKDLEGKMQELGPNWRTLFDPNSPNFFGKQVLKYRPTAQEITQFQAEEKKAKEGKLNEPAQGERKQFKQGWGVWNGKQWVPE